MGESIAKGPPPSGESKIRYIPLSYSPADSDASALALIHALRPEWASAPHEVEFVRFTDGITNTLLKAVNRGGAENKEAADRDSILLRAYGQGTDVLIDRHRETQNHELLMRHGLAPELLARFENGMLYRFVRGSVTQPQDMRKPDISEAIARRLGQWHATVPCISGRTHLSKSMTDLHALENGNGKGNGHANGSGLQETIDHAAPGKAAPNVWTVMQKWILALPADTEADRDRRANLQTELDRLVTELSSRPGLGKDGLVFAHTDLLSGNVIVLPPDTTIGGDTARPSVTFIDYEYAVPSPAAFDIANHFAEWGGFDCDMAVIPTVAQRRHFVDAFVRSYRGFLPAEQQKSFNESEQADTLMAEVDLFRGVPGFYWGVWALIQSRISTIDFGYAAYAESRLGEYWAWREESEGTRAQKGAEMPLRERRWAQES